MVVKDVRMFEGKTHLAVCNLYLCGRAKCAILNEKKIYLCVYFRYGIKDKYEGVSTRGINTQ